MTFFFDVQETSSLFAGHIEEVQQVLRANHVDFGTPFDFLTFAQTLQDDSQLRSDLAVRVRPLMEGEKKISLRTVLSIIAIAIGGPDLVASDCDKSQSVNLLVDFLMSVRSCSPASSQNPSCLEHEQHSEQIDASDQSALEAVATRSDQDPMLTDNHYVESLTRLEWNALQMKHYLDSIDQRINRMEPRMDDFPANIPLGMSQPGHAEHADAQHAAEGEAVKERISITSVLVSLSHPSQNEPPRELPPTHTIETPEMPSNLRTDSRPVARGRQFASAVIAALAAVTVVLFSLAYWSFHRNTPSTIIHPANPSLAEESMISPSNPALAADINTSHPSENATGFPSQTRAIAARTPSGGVNHRPSRNSTPVHPSAASPSSSTSATSSVASSVSPDESSYPSSLTQPINISSGVMAANVLSAPQPSYPKLASLTHMQGEVVMQAVISKDGTIENVHVIKGHRLLRGAATNAVRAWRYRPYRINGRPVEVATTVSIDFRRPQ